MISSRISRYGYFRALVSNRKHALVSLIQDLQSKASFAFVNSEEFTDFPRPITHKIVYIAGIGVGNPKPLDQVRGVY